MSERVYIFLEKKWADNIQVISGFILAYLEIRLGMGKDCKYSMENGNPYLYIMFNDRDEAVKVYNLLTPNTKGGIFSEIRLKTGYRTDGRRVSRLNGHIWHDR